MRSRQSKCALLYSLAWAYPCNLPSPCWLSRPSMPVAMAIRLRPLSIAQSRRRPASASASLVSHTNKRHSSSNSTMSLATRSTLQRKFANLAPSTYSTAKGLPVAYGINLNAAAPAAGHDDGHGHGHGPSPRKDYNIPKWANRVELSTLGAARMTSPANGACANPRMRSNRARLDWARGVGGRRMAMAVEDRQGGEQGQGIWSSKACATAPSQASGLPAPAVAIDASPSSPAGWHGWLSSLSPAGDLLLARPLIHAPIA